MKILGILKGKKMRRILFFLCILIVAGGTGYFYYRYMENLKAKRIAEEKRRQEELAKERERKLLEEKREEFENLIKLMKKYFALGKYKKVKELSKDAFALAKKYGFKTDQIEKILHQIEVKRYLAKLKKLEELSKNIFTYFYVRNELKKIPNFVELRDRIKRLKDKTFINEYLVYLYYAENFAEEGKKGENYRINYFLSKNYLDKGIRLREYHRITPEKERERKIARLQNEVFFSYSKLMKETTPLNIY